MFKFDLGDIGLLPCEIDIVLIVNNKLQDSALKHNKKVEWIDLNKLRKNFNHDIFEQEVTNA